MLSNTGNGGQDRVDRSKTGEHPNLEKILSDWKSRLYKLSPPTWTEYEFNPQTNEVIETRSTIVTEGLGTSRK